MPIKELSEFAEIDQVILSHAKDIETFARAYLGLRPEYIKKLEGRRDELKAALRIQGQDSSDVSLPEETS